MQSSAAVAAVVLMATSALATPVASPAPSDNIVLGTLDAEDVPAPEASGELLFSELDVKGGLKERSYYGSCSNCDIVRPNGQFSLRCDCRAENGSWKGSTLNLNGCLANANGRLVWRLDGGFQGSCDPGQYSMFNERVAFRCNPDRTVFTPYINLDEKIHNWNGLLVCQP